MRKLRRMIIKNEARKTGGKTSKVFKEMWHNYQLRKYGVRVAEIYRKVGTGRNKRMRMLMSSLSRG